MINLDGVTMKNKEVVKQIEKRFDQYTIGNLYSYSFKSEAGGWGKIIVKITKSSEVCGLGINICGKSITINQNVKDKTLGSIVGAIVWDNRDGTTRVTTHMEYTYEPGKDIEYYLEGASK